MLSAHGLGSLRVSEPTPLRLSRVAPVMGLLCKRYIGRLAKRGPGQPVRKTREVQWNIQVTCVV